MRFRNNRIPYMFPGWVDGEPMQQTVTSLIELWGTVVEELEDRYVIDLDPACLQDGVGQVRIEWLKECMEVLER